VANLLLELGRREKALGYIGLSMKVRKREKKKDPFLS
jgi:hypothetical protein